MEKRLILALAVSVMIILAFQYMTVKQPQPIVTGDKPQEAADRLPVKAQAPVDVISVPPAEEDTIDVETERYIITFSNIGGAIKEIRLKDFKGYKADGPMILADIARQDDYIMNISSMDADTNLSFAQYGLVKTSDAVIYTTRTKDWEISKKYILHNSSYGIDLQLTIKNISGSAKSFNYRIVGGSGVTEHTEDGKRSIEATASVDGKFVGYRKPKSGRTVNMGAVKWAALKNKYFSIILKPMSQSSGQFYGEGADGMLVMGVDVDISSIGPGASAENRFVLYAGPSHIPELTKFGHDFHETVNYGFFGGISKALISVMRFFYSLFHSWGIAIIMLSIFLNIVLFPLTMKSFQSMQKMQALHPQMEKLKKLHKDNPQKLNKEIMELYKKYKINPLSGCLPMLLQMPIFIALYQALMKSIELRNTSFLWIQDLSSPDAVAIPVTLPIIGNSIHILPLIMVAAMVMQQKMSSKTTGGAVTEEQKQQQKMMMIMMPIMFGFIFYNMPSGLVLYWVVNTSLTIVEQMAVMKNTAIES